MKWLVFVFLLLSMLFVRAQDDIVYVISLAMNGSEFSVTHVELFEGPGKNYPPQEQEHYCAQLLDFRGNELYTFSFRLSTFLTDGYEQPEVTYHVLTVPYFSPAKQLKIYDPQGELKLTFDLSDFAQCNQDFVCGSYENKGNCPDDCLREDIAEKRTEGQLQEVTTPRILNRRGGLFLVVAFILLLIAIAVFLLRRKH